jgi:hypothetical protein
LNGWWWNWNTLLAQYGYVGVGAESGSVHTPGVEPFVQPGPPTSPFAFDQPPEYQAHETPAPLRRSPIVGFVCGGSGATGGNAPCGMYAGRIVFTAQLPHGVRVTGDVQATVSWPRRTGPVAV